jgi:hypothetical protein
MGVIELGIADNGEHGQRLFIEPQGHIRGE